VNSIINTTRYGDIYFYTSNLKLRNLTFICDNLQFKGFDNHNINLEDIKIVAVNSINFEPRDIIIKDSYIETQSSFYIRGQNVSILNTKFGESAYDKFYIYNTASNVTIVNSLIKLKMSIYGNNVTVIGSTLIGATYIDSYSSNIVFENVEFENSIDIRGSSVQLINCTVRVEGDDAIAIRGSHVLIDKCTVSSTDYKAFYLSSSARYVTITNNVIYGYVETEADYLDFINNTIISVTDYRGVEILGGEYLTVMNNYIINGSFYVFEYDLATLATYDIDSNYVNDLPVYFWVSRTVETIEMERIGTLILINCKNITIKNSVAYGIELFCGGNITIENVISMRAYCGLYLSGDVSNVHIFNASFVRNCYGIMIQSVKGITILNSTIAFNYKHGVTNTPFAVSENAYIINSSIVSNVGHGVYISVTISGDKVFLNVTHNWWGSELGPEEKSSSDPFDPEEVYGDVNYSPWLTKPATVIDSTPPMVNIISPTENSLISSKFLDIVIEASDDSGIDCIEVYIDGKFIARVRVPPFTISWNCIAGEHLLEVYAYDLYGNMNYTSVSFVVDLVPPNVEIQSPLPNSFVGGLVTILINANDDYGIDHVEIYIDNQKIAEINNEPYVYDWNTTNWSDGQHTITAKAFDLAGASNEESINVYVDNTPPSIGEVNIIEGDYINNTAMANVVIQAEVSDALSGVSQVVLAYRVGEEGDWTEINMTKKDNLWEATIPELPVGNISIKVIANDGAGNVKEYETSFEIKPREKGPSLNIPLIIGIIIIIIAIIIAIMKFRRKKKKTKK